MCCLPPKLGGSPYWSVILFTVIIKSSGLYCAVIIWRSLLTLENWKSTDSSRSVCVFIVNGHPLNTPHSFLTYLVSGQLILACRGPISELLLTCSMTMLRLFLTILSRETDHDDVIWTQLGHAIFKGCSTTQEQVDASGSGERSWCASEKNLCRIITQTLHILDMSWHTRTLKNWGAK